MKTKRIKALWLPSWYPTPKDLTNGIFTRRDAEAASLFCDIIVLYAIENNGSKYEVEITKVSPGLMEIRVFYPYGSKLTKIWRFLKAYRKGFLILKQKKMVPDILHLHVIWPVGIAALYFYFSTETPMLISEHWSGYRIKDAALSKWRVWFAQYLAKKARTIFTVNKDISEAMQDFGISGRYVINPNVVRINIDKIKKKSSDSKFKFIHVSSLNNCHKNISGILKALKRLMLIKEDFKMIFIGGDEGTALYEKMTVELGINSIVSFKGVLDNENVLEEMATCDAFVLFSNYEGLPCVMLEALSVGIPVISTELAGFSNWITPTTGMLIPIADEDALVKAMCHIIDNYEQFDPEIIRQKVLLECNYEIVGKSIFYEYQRALGVLDKTEIFDSNFS